MMNASGYIASVALVFCFCGPAKSADLLTCILNEANMTAMVDVAHSEIQIDNSGEWSPAVVTIDPTLITVNFAQGGVSLLLSYSTDTKQGIWVVNNTNGDMAGLAYCSIR